MQSTSEKAPCCASRTCRVVVLWTVQLLAIPVCAFVPFGNEALTALIAVCIVVGRLLPLCVKRAIKPADVQKEAPRVANDTPTATESTKSTKPVKTRLLWLDILKLGLTVLVAVPGSFIIPLVFWTPLVLKLGAPPDAEEVRANPAQNVSIIGMRSHSRVGLRATDTHASAVCPAHSCTATAPCGGQSDVARSAMGDRRGFIYVLRPTVV